MIETNKNKYWTLAFKAYTRRYLAKHFFRVHFANENPTLKFDGTIPTIGIMNHSSWWDVLISFYLTNHLLPFDSYGVMDEPQLQRYRFFSKVGLYSVNRESGLTGIKEFLSYSQKLLTAAPNRIVWVCPQGDLVSNDLRPIRFFPGVAHLVKHLGRCQVLPLALDYEFCQEPQPEAFALLGKPILFESSRKTDAEKLNKQLEEAMTRLMDQLKEKTKQRDFSSFTPLVSGKKGIHKIYDTVTRLRFRLQGKNFHRTHGTYESKT